MKTDDLEIIIVTYNSQFWLKKALDSLQEFFLSKTKKKVAVSVVDNASTDETVSMVKKEYRWVKLHQMSENQGFAVANNVAIGSSNAKYVMLMNSDVELTEHSNFDELLKQLDDRKNVGVITPLIRFTDGGIDIACHRGEPTLWASFTYFFKLEKLFPTTKLFAQYHQTYKNLEVPHEIDACSGALMVVRYAAIKKTGLLDERFFMYAEDLDWCRRFRENGYSVLFYPKVTVIHHKNKSGIKSSSQVLAIRTKQHFYDTMLQYYDKHYRKKYPFFIRLAIKYFLVIKKGAL